MTNNGLNMPNSSSHGFTMIEMLVVVAIICLLAALLLPVFTSARRQAKETTGRGFMKSIETACAAYEFDWGFYPPDKATIAGRDYVSSEALYYYLTTPFRLLNPNIAKGEIQATKDGGPYLDVPEKHRRDLNGNGQLEVIDSWDRPLEYDNIRDDPIGTPVGSGYNAYTAPSPFLDADPRGGAAKNLQGFDLYSFGAPTKTSTKRRPLGNFKCSWE